MIALALIVSIAIGTVLTRSILALTDDGQAVRRQGLHRAHRESRRSDEIGQLGENFNAMAATIQEHSENLEGLVKQRTKELIAEKQTSRAPAAQRAARRRSPTG